MTEVKRGPGRPPKVRPEAEISAEEVSAETMTLLVEPVAEAPRMIEVQLLRKYAPAGQTQEIKTMVPAGTVMMLPVDEATRALKLRIACGTDKTLG